MHFSQERMRCQSEVTILCGKILALFPDLPHFTLRFVWTIIHRSRRVKNVKGLGDFIM